MKKILLIAAATILSGCAQSGYKQFYNPYVDARTLPNVELIGPNEEPQIFGSNNIDQDIRTLRSKRYIVVGYSSFNGGYEDTKNAAAQAKRIGATVVLTNSEYTNTQSSTSALLLPNNQTTYHSGSVYGGGTYGGYSGTSTTYGTTAVPFTTHQRRYDQVAVYLVKSTQKIRFGVSVNDLTPGMRTELERNTGALIDIVIEDTPAFYSNVMAGDILVSIDGQPVKNGQHAIELMAAVPESQPSSSFLVIRKGEEKSIKVTF
ncbi:PDZ domain-containing protein [Thalassotalea agariperforans]